jgi:guanylate kinase
MTKLIVISAPSGAGKTTLCQMLLRDFPELELSISSTTRGPRGSEQHGKEYFFLSREAFERDIQEGHFAEWAIVHGNYYGTSKKVVEHCFGNGKSVLLDIDVQGAESIRKAYPDRSLLVFISPPNMEILEARLRARGTETEAAIQKRLNNSKQEMEKAKVFDHVIVNDQLDRAYLELKRLLHKNGLKEGGQGVKNG